MKLQCDYYWVEMYKILFKKYLKLMLAKLYGRKRRKIKKSLKNMLTYVE